MLRTKLLDKLVLVSPALSGNNLVPLLSHFWFCDDILLAYNDKIAIQTDFDSGLVGAVPETLVSLLSVSMAKEVEFLTDHKGLMIKAASSNLRLPMLDLNLKKPIFAMPLSVPQAELVLNMRGFLDGLSLCMHSLKENSVFPDSLGITFVFQGDENFHIYVTDDETISSAHFKLKKPVKAGRIMLSGDFCRQMLSISKALNPMSTLEIHDDFALFTCGDTVLFGRFVDVQSSRNFAAHVKDFYPKEAVKSLVPIPSKLEYILDRAAIITNVKLADPRTEITVTDGVAHFYSHSKQGEVRDQMQVGDHDDVKVTINPNLLRSGYGYFDKFLMTKKGVVMTRGSSLYLVSASAHARQSRD